MALHISRMIDVAPEVELKVKLLNTQRELTKSLMAVEMICKTRDVEPIEEDNDDEEEKKDGEEKKGGEGKAIESEAKKEEDEGMLLRSGKVINKDIGVTPKPSEGEKEGDAKEEKEKEP